MNDQDGDSFKGMGTTDDPYFGAEVVRPPAIACDPVVEETADMDSKPAAKSNCVATVSQNKKRP